jgi:hypothetical protein
LIELPDAFRLDASDDGYWPVVAAQGVDMSTTREMDAELARPVDAGRASTVVDLSGVSFIDSGKLRLYVMCSPREQIHPDASGPPRAATDRTEGPLQ